MALAQEAQTLLMDEPTAFLDISHQLALMDTAASLAREGRAVVMVLHDLALALRRADRLAVLSAGELLAEGTPAEICGLRRHRPGVQRHACAGRRRRTARSTTSPERPRALAARPPATVRRRSRCHLFPIFIDLEGRRVP